MLLLLSGCGILHKPSHKEQVWSKLGVDSTHFKTCGPMALQNLHYHYGEEISNQTISISLQENRFINIFKGLGLINVKFRQITCPPELRGYLTRNGFEYEKITYNDLEEGDFAILLLKGYDDLHDWHWASYPTDKKNILTFFGEYTKIITVYRITKK